MLNHERDLWPKKRPSPLRHRPSLFVASIYPGHKHELPMEFVTAINGIEEELKMPVWLLVQGDEDDEEMPLGSIDWLVLDLFRKNKKNLPKQEIALVVDSPGGDAHAAYQLAMLIRRCCTAFTAIVPRWAKSAATLLCLASKEIYLGEEGQLGALDAQILDRDKEEHYISALDDVGAIQELEERAIEAAVASLFFMQSRTKKKLNLLMPLVFDFVAKLHQPLFDKIDSIRFSRMCRVLSVAEKYAIMLLQPRFSEQEAGWIARDLVKTFPSHRFTIDVEQCQRIGARPRRKAVGLQVAKHNANISAILDDLYVQFGGSFKAIGRIEEKP